MTKTSKIIIGIAVAVVLVMAALGLYIGTEIKGTFKGEEKISIAIPGGSSTAQIAQILKEKGAISNGMLFRFYHKTMGNEAILKKGNFLVEPKGGYQGIITVLSNRPNDPNNNMSITITEGENLLEIGKKLEEKGICTQDDFLKAINQNYGFSFEEHVKDSALKLFLNEGYAFPDTYSFATSDTPETVAKSFLQNFDTKFKKEYYSRLKELGMTLDEVIALASIIQHEAAKPEDMKKVSSVFYNRLKSKDLRKLQSDVTVFYARDIVGVRTDGNQEMINAYSTYLSEGIPVGAICNPGLDAIVAALYPDDTDYLYFLTDKTGKFYYAKTFEEHKKYNTEAEKVNANLK